MCFRPLDPDIHYAAYRWNLTLISELVVESIPQLVLTIMNGLQMANVNNAELTVTFYGTVITSAVLIVWTLYPLAFWLFIGTCVERSKTPLQALEVPIFPLNRTQMELRKQNQERIRFLEYDAEGETKTGRRRLKRSASGSFNAKGWFGASFNMSNRSLDNALGQTSTSPRPDTPVPQGLPVEGGEPSELEAAEQKPKATAKLPAPGAMKQDSKGRTVQYA